MAKSPKRKEYLKDYKLDNEGKYRYSGKSYKFDGTEQERRKVYRDLLILAVILLVPIAASGFTDAPCAIRAFYVIIPFIGEVSSYFALVWYLSKLMFEGRSIRGYIFETANNRIPPACQILMFFAILGLAASLLYIAFNGFEGEVFKDFLYISFKACDGILAFCFKKYYNRVNWVVL